MRLTIANKINALCNTVPAKLRTIPEEHLCFRQSPEKWSKKEILGHLIDSATNNHQRFIRGQLETPVIYYDQNIGLNFKTIRRKKPKH